MAALAQAFVEVRPQTDRFPGELKRQIGKVDGKRIGDQVGTRIGVGMHGAIASAVSRSAKLFVVGFAAIQGAKVFSGFIADAQESARVARLTANVIRTTGGAAKITAGQVDALATAISNKTGVDDEAVQTGANLLLTFKNIKREGTGLNDVFGRATAAAIDLSAAGFGDINGASKALGKALNEPLKGITALGRAGVTFTAKQKEQIAALVKTGDVLGAQKIILKEVESQVGGAAAAAADPIAKLRTILGNVGEDIGTLVLPAISKFATFVGARLVPGIYAAAQLLKGGFTEGLQGNTGFAGVLERIGDVAHRVVAFVTGTVLPGFRALFSAFKDPDITSDGFAGVMEHIGVVLRRVVDFISGTVIPAVNRFAQVAGPVLVTAFRAVAGFIIDRVIPALREVGGFITDTVLPAAVRLGGFLATTFGPAVRAISQAFTQNLLPALQNLWAIIKQNLPAMLTFAKFIGGVVAVVGFLVLKLAGFLLPILIKVAGFLLGRLFNLLATTIQYFGNLVRAVQRTWEGFQSFLKIVSAVWGTFVSVARGAIANVVRVFLDLVGTIINGAAKAFGWVPGLGGKLKDAAAKFNTFRDSVNTALGGVNDQTVNVRVQLGAGRAVVGSGANAIRIEADGGILKRFAAGAENHIAQIARPGEMRLWAEPETGGEAYIPLAQQKRQRSTAILSSVARRFGYSLTAAANGMIRAEDGSLVPTSFYGGSRGGVRAEDGSIVSASFYGRSRSGLKVASQVAGAAKFNAALDSYERGIERFATRVGQAVKKVYGGGNVVEFAKRYAGRIPYVWGGAAPTGADCSGWISTLVNVAKGVKNPWHRLFSTGTLPAGLFAPGHGAFDIGWFTGNPGHVAATINGYNTESRGGDGVVGGSRSRGAGQGIFNRHGHLKGFASGGIVRWGDVSESRWNQLLAAGWRGRAGDRMEALYRPARSWVTGGDGARAKMLRSHINHGGRFFEDFSYRGASAFYRRGNDRLADHFWAGHRGFNFGGPRTRPVVGSWLNSVITQAIYGIRQRRLADGGILPGDPPFDLLDRRGKHYRPGLLDALKDAQRFGVRSYDQGGKWPNGTLGVNTSGGTETVLPPGPQRLHPADIQALGEVIGRVVVGGIRSNDVAVGRTADLILRGG